MKKRRTRGVVSDKIIIRSQGEFRVDRSCGIYGLNLENGDIFKAELERLEKKNGLEVYRINERPMCVYIPALGIDAAKRVLDKIFASQIKVIPKDENH